MVMQSSPQLYPDPQGSGYLTDGKNNFYDEAGNYVGSKDTGKRKRRQQVTISKSALQAITQLIGIGARMAKSGGRGHGGGGFRWPKKRR